MQRFWLVSPRCFVRRAVSRWVALLCLLPLLVMGALSNAPHAHELRPLLRAASSVQAEHGATHGTARWAPRVQEQNEECLLCQWASVAGAGLLAAFAFWRPLSRAMARSARPAVFYFPVVFFALRSRAPPA